MAKPTNSPLARLNSSGLSPLMEHAALKLAIGTPVAEVAKEIHRSAVTVYQWLQIPEFQAAVRLNQAEHLAETRRKWLELSMVAATELEKILTKSANNEHRLRAAEIVMRTVRPFAPEVGSGIGPKTATEIRQANMFASLTTINNKPDSTTELALSWQAALENWESGDLDFEELQVKLGFRFTEEQAEELLGDFEKLRFLAVRKEVAWSRQREAGEKVSSETLPSNSTADMIQAILAGMQGCKK